MKEPLSIRNFFAGKHVLLTGATGFLAKAVMEKFLHDLPEVGGIYLLIRPRRKSDGTLIPSRERVRDEIFRNSAFGRLREKFGDDFEAYCESKITCISGDLTLENLGLEPALFRELAAKLDVIINSAATVVFDERLDLALSLNTMGPLRLMELARAGHAQYVHISTAYVCGKRIGPIPERLLKPLEAIDAQLPAGEERPRQFVVTEEIEYLAKLAEETKARCNAEIARRNWDPKSEEAKELMEKELVAAGMKRSQKLGWNDTYTFTKFLGEQLVHDTRGKVPVVIVRPSIIESSLRDPEPGWLDGLRMADPIIIGFGKGRLNDFPANRDIVLDIIPADFVVNGVLAAAAHIARVPGGFDLFTVASSTKNPLWFESLYTHVRDYFIKHPFTDRAGKPIRVTEWKFRTIKEYRKLMVNRYLRPAQLGLALVNGPIPIPGARKWRPRLKTHISKIEQLLYYVDIYGPYVNLDCRFETERSFELLDALSPEERKLFNFDTRCFHWRGYLQDVHIPGLKRNILRMDAVPRTGASQGKLLEEEASAPKRAAAHLATIRGVPQTIVDIARRGHERYGAKTFVEIRRAKPENGPAHVKLSYTEFFEQAGRLAQLLGARLNLHTGDRVALIGENSPEWCLAYLAIVRSGATAVPLDRMLPAAEVARILSLVSARAMIVSPQCLKNLRAALGEGNHWPVGLNLLAGCEPFPGQQWPQPDADPAARALRDPAPETLASLLFTSGTTLEPKGVMLTHGNFVANTMAVSEVLEPLESDRFLSVLPLHHAFEFTAGFLIPMLGGSTIFHVENLRGQEVLDTMKLNEVTVLLGVPRLFKLFQDGINTRLEAAGPGARALLELGEIACLLGEVVGAELRPRVFRKVHDAFGGHIRVFISGGAALDPEIFHFFNRFGLTVCEGYGLTETSPVLSVNPLSAPKAGSVGPVVPGMEINIQALDADDTIGEIVVRGPAVMHGYWQNPQATAAVFDNGWFKTGDLGRFDEDGYLLITGRLKDVIVTSAGKNVYPDDVEHHLRDIAGVKELCVIGLPGRGGQGEDVAVVVVPETPEARPGIEAAITQICAQMPSHQRVSRIECQAEDLPKTTTLKVQRAKVRDRYLAGGPPAKGSPASPATALTAIAREALAETSTTAVEVARALARVAGNISAADIAPHQKLQMDLGIDSIGRVDLLQHLEARFGINFPPGTEDKVFTVQDVIQLVERSVADRGTAKPKRARRLWERARIKQDALEAGMRQTSGRIFWRRGFEAVTGLIMSTHLRVRGDGLQNLPKDRPYILAANHSSHLDLPAIRRVLGPAAENLHAMAAKDYFFDTPFKHWFFTTFLNALPLDREANAAESLAACKTVLDSGRSILIFPEGTRTLTGELQPFKPGIGVLALELEYPIVPVWLQGTYDALPKGRVLPRNGHIEVRIGAPVDFAHLRNQRELTSTSELYRRAAIELRARVEDLADLPPIRERA